MVANAEQTSTPHSRRRRQCELSEWNFFQSIKRFYSFQSSNLIMFLPGWWLLFEGNGD